MQILVSNLRVIAFKNWDNCGCSSTSIALELQVVLSSPLTQQLFGYLSTEHLFLKVLAISASPWCHDHNLDTWQLACTYDSCSLIITTAICSFLCQLPSNKRNGKAGWEGHKLLLSRPTLQQLSQTSLRHISSLCTLLCLEAVITSLEPHWPLVRPPLLKSSHFRPCP